jgi:hypothetical protein
VVDARLRTWALALGAALAVGGCAPSPRAVAPPAETPSAPSLLDGGAWGSFHSKRFGLDIPLPSGRAWTIDDHATPWLVARHDESHSRLLVRSWQANEIVNRERCESAARAWMPLPEREGAELIDEHPLAFPPDHDTRVEVRIAGSHERIDGLAMAFGGWAHRCFAWVYTTQASGRGAEAAVAARLAVMVEQSLGKSELVSPRSPRVTR